MKNRQIVRVKWNSYQNGCYFVTICTKDKIHYFGEIQNDKMKMSELGKVLETCILNTPTIRHDQYIELPIFTIMPNHLHFIIILNSELEHHQHYFGSQSKNLSSIVRGIKSALTTYARHNNIPFDWQPRFYEHIIQSEKSFHQIYDYIENNVKKWSTDCFY